VIVQKFLTWLGEDSATSGVTTTLAERRDESIQSASLKTAEQITLRRSPLNPQRLVEIAAEYEARQLRESDEEYEAFLPEGYPNFLQWVESLIEQSASLGGRLLMLTFDNSTGIVSATAGVRKILAPTSIALPISQSALPRLAAAVTGHFQQASFQVQTSRRESTCSRFGTQSTPGYDCVDIFWMETRVAYPNPDHFIAREAPLFENPQETIGNSEPDRTRSYQTAPLTEYLSSFQKRALELFSKIKQRLGEGNAKASKGSFSIVSSAGHHTVAKIIIYENGLGKANGDLRDLSDGVYLLVRASGPVGDRIWNSEVAGLGRMERARTIGIAPKHAERFAFALVSEQDDDEEIAGIMQDCVKAADFVRSFR
jgi:hypothetical protein